MGLPNTRHRKVYIGSCLPRLQLELVKELQKGTALYILRIKIINEHFCYYTICLFQLLSASTDHNVCIWDVLSGECEQRYRFPTPILRVQFDPRNDKRFLVCPMRHAALLVDTDGDHKILPIDDDVSLYLSSYFLNCFKGCTILTIKRNNLYIFLLYSFLLNQNMHFAD